MITLYLGEYFAFLLHWQICQGCRLEGIRIIKTLPIVNNLKYSVMEI